MRAAPGQRERVLAVVRALKTAGVRVRNWKNFIQTQPAPQESLQTFAFGRDLQLLPQRLLPEPEGAVPLFLVEACEYLSQHLHTEGLFRKTGSLARIRAVRADLERGVRVFCPPRVAALQPCDVASLLKQFLRELPQPLVPADLQGALCQAQSLEAEGPRDRATLLLTALLPPAHARTLRYFCTFLSRVAHRCDENRMEVGNLALVMAPNLLKCPTQPCRLTVHTEKQLDQQTAVIKALILHAQHIGVLPSSVLDSLASAEVPESTPPGEGAVFTKTARLGVYRSLRRQRRRSVGEMFVDAFSKLKAGRTSTMTLDSPLEGRPLSRSPNPQSPGAGKRKASEETVLEMDGSAKKRRSLHDLREDVQSISSHSADESADSQSPQGMKNSREDLHHNVTERKSHLRAHRKSYRPPRQEEHVRGRRRSLRFFTMSSSSSLVSACINPDPSKLQEDKPSNSESEKSLKIPFILIDGSRAVLVGSEVDDDPDLLNCSFVENPDEAVQLETPETFHTLQRQDREEPSEELADDDDHWVLLEDGSSEVVVEYKVKQDLHQTETQPQAKNESPNAEDTTQIEEKEERPPLVLKQLDKNSKKGSRPRRSISMPEVTLEPCSDEADESQREISVKQPAFDVDFWSEPVNLLPSGGLSTEGNKTGGKEKERRENAVRRKYGSVLERKKDQMTHSDPSSKRTQRRSVAERLRSFSALAAFLRTPRTSVPRLRRQGARRFSRSFSHEGVPELVPGESPQNPQEDQQAFVDLSEGCGDSSKHSYHQLLFDASTGCGPAVNPPSEPSSVEDVTLVGSPQRSMETQQLQLEEPELQSVLGSEGHEPELDLHDLLERQCHLVDQDQDQDQDSAVFSESTPQEHCLNVLNTASSPSHQQGESLNSLIDFNSSPAANCSQYSCFSERYPGPDSTLPYEASRCKDITHLSFDGLISISSNVSEKYSLSLELSPPAFQFRQQDSRRRYRDSPRWPSHQVRMTTWKPLPL